MNIMHTWCGFIDVLISYTRHIGTSKKSTRLAQLEYSQWQMTTVVYCESAVGWMVMV